MRRLSDLRPVAGRSLMPELHVRRLVCQSAECPQRTFRQQVPELALRFARRTLLLTTVVGQLAITLAGRAGAAVLAARIIRTPVRAPRANAIAERFIGTLHRECLNHLLIIGPRHLAVVLHEFIEHYNNHRRPHRSLDQQPPAGRTPPSVNATVRPLRRDRLGGLLHEYVQVA